MTNCGDCFYMKAKLPLKEGVFRYDQAIAKCKKNLLLDTSGHEKTYKNLHKGQNYVSWVHHSCLSYQSMIDN